MACCLCGGDEWIKTVRDGEGRTFPVCDPCYLASDPDPLVIVPGPISVTGRCDRCDRFLNPRELAVRRALVKEVYRGTCEDCAGSLLGGLPMLESGRPCRVVSLPQFR